MICQNDDFCVASCCAGFSRKVHLPVIYSYQLQNPNIRERYSWITTTISGKKIIIFILGAVLIIAVLSIIAIFSSAIMRLLGFEYESVGGFILYFIIASIVSYPMNLVAGAFPKALLNLDRITREMAVCMYVLLDTITTFFGFYIVDYFMPSVSANTISLIVLALVFALFGISDVKKKES